MFLVVQGHLQKLCILKQASTDASHKIRREQDVLYKMLYSNLPCFGFPNILYTKSNQTIHEILISPLGPSLQEVLEELQQPINEVLVYKIVFQLTNRLEKLHNVDYTHGRVILSNVFLGKKDSEKIYLSNFYHSRYEPKQISRKLRIGNESDDSLVSSIDGGKN